jgi:hypothetical protein
LILSLTFMRIDGRGSFTGTDVLDRPGSGATAILAV